MTTIVKVPATVESFFSDLDVPLTDVQRLHLAEYGTGLAVSENVTITGINGLLVNGVDQSNMNRTLTQATWDTEALNRGRLKLLQRHPGTMWGKKGLLVVDDTFIDKDGKLLPGAAYLYNHSKSRTEWGQQLVTLQYVGPRVDYPLDFRQYFKETGPEVVSGEVEFKKKHELAAEMVRAMRALGCPARTVLMDSWYLCKAFVKVLEEEQLDWIARLKSDRLVMLNGVYVPVKEFAGTLGRDDVREVKVGGKTYWVYEFKTRLKKIGKVKAVISWKEADLSDDPKYFATNHRPWSSSGILVRYTKRWAIEEFYRDAKQHLGLGECQMRSAEGTRRHWYMVLLMHSLLTYWGAKHRRKVGSGKDGALTIGDCQRALEDEVFRDLLELIIEKALGDEDRMPKEKQKLVMELMGVLKG